MPEIPFTQYMRPNGRPVPVMVQTDDATAQLAQTLIASGYVFECEVLTTGQVSLTCGEREDESLAHEIVNNGPEIAEAVKTLVRNAVFTFTGSA